MAVLPTFPITSISRRTLKPALKKSYDGGYEQQRLKYTKSIKEFKITYGVLDLIQAQELEDFFNANQGASFDFTDETFQTTHTVRFEQDDITLTQIQPKYYTTSITVREI